jgi:hypothetical protein
MKTELLYIEEELAQVDDLLKESFKLLDKYPDDVSIELTIRSLEYRRKELTKEKDSLVNNGQ